MQTSVYGVGRPAGSGMGFLNGTKLGCETQAWFSVSLEWCNTPHEGSVDKEPIYFQVLVRMAMRNEK